MNVHAQRLSTRRHRVQPEGELTPADEERVLEVVRELADEWRGQDYNLLEKNCCHFSHALCKRLDCAQAFPPWLFYLANTGARAADGVETAKAAAVKIGRELDGAFDAATASAEEATASVAARFKALT